MNEFTETEQQRRRLFRRRLVFYVIEYQMNIGEYQDWCVVII